MPSIFNLATVLERPSGLSQHTQEWLCLNRRHRLELGQYRPAFTLAAGLPLVWAQTPQAVNWRSLVLVSITGPWPRVAAGMDLSRSNYCLHP